MNRITPDLIFSYWIYAWFIAYYIIITISTKRNIIIQNANPTLVLYIALIENIISLFYLFLSTYDFSLLFIYLLMLLLLKVLPIYLLFKEGERAPVNILPNIAISLVITIIYLGYVEIIKGISVIKLYANIMKSIIMRENKTPFFKFYSLVEQQFQRNKYL